MDDLENKSVTELIALVVKLESAAQDDAQHILELAAECLSQTKLTKEQVE